MQNIFFYNQLSVTSLTAIEVNPSIKQIFLLPNYCNQILTSDYQKNLKSYNKAGLSLANADQLIRVYADGLKNAGDSYNMLTFRLILALLISNFTGLFFQTIHLYEESKDMDRES